jgi:hypothetical protein
MKKASQQRGLFVSVSVSVSGRLRLDWARKSPPGGEGFVQKSIQRLKLGGSLQWPSLFVPVGEKPRQVNIHPLASPIQEGQDCRHDAINLTGLRIYGNSTQAPSFFVSNSHDC